MPPVTITNNNEIAIVTVNNPPVNALSHAVREGLENACEILDADDGVKAVVLICKGNTFIAGADIREFSQPPLEPHLPQVINRIEQAQKPWITAIHGRALGGGLEVCLGCHYRLAIASARFGLPEVHLGLIPGAGGTVRLPRLTGVEPALEIITGGKLISAQKALEIGMIDKIVKGDNLEADAVSFARSKLHQSLPVAVSQRNIPNPPPKNRFQGIISGIEAKARGQHSPVEAARCILEGISLTSEQAFSAERERFAQLKESVQSAALRHVFFAERQTAKVEEIKNIKPRTISRCGVIGGGTMGAGISTSLLLAGKQVIMIERDYEAAQSGLERVEKNLASSLSRGIISNEKHQEILYGFSASTQYHDLADAELVVEAVFEDMDAKQQVFAQLAQNCPPDTILATNTSYLNVNKIAERVKNPERVLGLHFFSPAHIMKLVEVIRSNRVSGETLATGFKLVKELNKVPVLSGVCEGFIGNRILASYRKQCDYMLEDGASPETIDSAMRNFGMAMGPFEMQDMAGLDISWANRKRLAANRDPNERYVHIADQLCEMGRFGQKTGCGWYQYPKDSRKGVVDPIVEALIREEREKQGIIPRNFTMAEIQNRILKAMVSEGQKILDEDIARSAADIDMVFILGYGFPRWRGGPMFAGGVF